MRVTRDIRLIGCHVHVREPDGLDNLTAITEAMGLHAISILCCPILGQDNALALLYKLQRSQSVYVFGGLRHALGVTEVELPDFATQARNLIAAGCDGIKMLEGKPNAAGRLSMRSSCLTPTSSWRI